jgi:GTPase SAR1 family protein
MLKQYGHVLVLHGQPGDGKTTFCKKAVHVHCKEGQPREVPRILLFGLNPSNTVHSVN